MTAEAESSFDRLERALQVFVAHAESGGDAQRLLAEHGDLRELLEPMLASGEQVAPVGGDASDSSAGKGRVLGDFRLVRELGRGGMGIVWAAWQRSLDRQVALKLLSPALLASPSAIARFRREAAAVGKLRHQAIVEVHGFGSVGEEHFFAMELVDGAPLTQCAGRFRTPAAAVALVTQLVDALLHAHAHGLVHRDVKPGNVMVRADDSAVLTDFGLAHDAELPSVTTDGSFLGTLDYASPEQLQGGAVDARTDLWSIGVLLHELLAGRRPFARSNATATMKAVLTEDPPSLRRAAAAVPADLAAIVDRALQKDPARRYATAALLLADLRAWQAGGVVSVRAPGTFERLSRWARREPWRASTAAVLLLGVPLLTAVLGYLWANAPRIAAAASAEIEQQRELVFARAWWQAMQGDAAATLQLLDSLPPDPDDVELGLSRAMALNRLGRQAEAAAALAERRGVGADFVRARIEARASDPLATTTKELTAFECFLLASAALQEQKGRPADRDRARRCFELATLAVTLSAKPRESHLLVWADAAQLTRDPSAMAAAGSALERHFPDEPMAMESRSNLLMDTDPAQSLLLLERAFIGRETAAYHSNRGVRLQQVRRFADAEAAYRAAIAASPDYGIAWLNLGNVLRRENKDNESRDALQKAVELLPRNGRAWNGLGLTLARLADPGAAKAAYAKAVELEPGYAVALYNLGGMEENDGNVDTAAELYRRAIQADAKYVLGYQALGKLLHRDHRPQEALLEFLHGTWLAPDDADLQAGLARAALDSGLAALARSAAERAGKLKDCVANRILIARAQALGGDRDGALARLDAAERDPPLAQDPDRNEIARWRTELQAK